MLALQTQPANVWNRKMQDTLTFAQIITQYLERSSMSIRQLAEKAGVSHTTLSNWLNGYMNAETRPKANQLIAVARVMDENAIKLLVLAYPELKRDFLRATGVSPDAFALTEMLESLSDGDRKIVETFIRQRASTGSKNNKE